MKITREIWSDFLDNAVDASGSAGWRWFEKKYKLDADELADLMVSNQVKADAYDDLKRTINIVVKKWYGELNKL